MQANNKITSSEQIDYKPLFQAILSIKDQEIGLKLLKVLNEHIKQKSQNTDTTIPRKNVTTAASQTCESDFKLSSSIDDMISIKSKKVQDSNGIKRRRRRINKPFATHLKPVARVVTSLKNNLPKVNSQNVSNNAVNSGKSLVNTNSSLSDEIDALIASCNIGELMDSDFSKDFLEFFNQIQTNTAGDEQEMKKIITKLRNFASEWSEDEYLPVHSAIIDGNIRYVQIQLTILKHLNFNILEPAAEGESALHLAIKNAPINESVSEDIVKLVLQECSDINSIQNNEGQTILHYAVKFLNNVTLFELILSKITELKSLLIQNDDGQNVLHLAVRLKKASFVKSILLFIDEKLKIVSIDRDFRLDKYGLYQYLDYVKKMGEKSFKERLNPEKMTILRSTERNSNKTAIYIGVTQASDLIVLMLLAHFADTQIMSKPSDSQNIQKLALEVEANPIIQNALIAATAFHKRCRDHEKQISKRIANNNLKRKLTTSIDENNRKNKKIN